MHGDDGERTRSPDTGLFLTASSLASVLRLLALIAVFFVRAAPPRCPAPRVTLSWSLVGTIPATIGWAGQSRAPSLHHTGDTSQGQCDNTLLSTSVIRSVSLKIVLNGSLLCGGGGGRVVSMSPYPVNQSKARWGTWWLWSDQQCCEMLETVTGGCNYGAGPRLRYQLLYQGHYVSSDGPPPATLTVPSTLGHHRNYAGTGGQTSPAQVLEIKTEDG